MLHHVIRGAGRPMLVLHGGKLDHRHMLDAVEPVFEGQPGWRRVYADLPGHGRSPASAEIRCQDDVLAHVAAFAEEIFAGQPYAVIGESRGSHIAQGLAARWPERIAGLLLIVPGGNAPGSRRPPHEVLVPAPEIRAGLEEALGPRFDRLVVQSAEIAEKIARTKAPATALHDAAQEARIAEAFAYSRPVEAAGAFPGPSLLVAGRQDAVAGYHDTLAWADLYPRATLAVLDTAGHSLAWERPELFKALAQDWLARLARGEAGRA